jgi:hypothetical protein
MVCLLCSELPTVRIACSNATVHSELKDAQRALETQCRVEVAIAAAGEGASSPSSSHVLTHSVSDSCRGPLPPDSVRTMVSDACAVQ